MKEDRDDELTIDKMKEGINFLEHAVPSKTPDLSQFRRLVAEVEEKKQARKNYEVFIFMLSAIFVLGIETYAFSQSIILFAAIQVTALISFPLSIISWKKYQSRQVKLQ